MAKSQTKSTNYNAIYFFAVFVPGVSAVFMAVIPAWSPGIGKAVFAVLALNMLVALIMKLTRYIEKTPARKIAYGISQFHLFTAFLLGVVWRVWGGGVLAAVVLIVLQTAAVYTGYVYRRTIFKEVLQPGSRIGKIVYAAGLLGGGAAGLIGYGLSQWFSSRFENMMPFYVSLVFIPVSLYILLVVYAGWIKAEDPEWMPDSKNARRSAGKRPNLPR
ncbi:hypothetical protein MUG84_08680 [Paenibacillus sp. KQZ6P-2]|uniref:Uncharacterized protein n=1 Tax=Paenibacillus mangrovi TaxID=2931978 RepID=A0A9X1WNM1_9BACL|nr:hypothetical protein [Paenibacillus mangrovi]MCJ8011816.1 hypothetical protein [Paenibacillus mangrovi]